MKSLKIDIVMPWEYGLIIFLIGLTLIIYGVKQGKNKDDDFTKIPLIKPTTKIIFGTFLIIFGSIQLLPLLKNL
jgi:vacuolar-type H+-ATPase subunit I/STV1